MRNIFLTFLFFLCFGCCFSQDCNRFTHGMWHDFSAIIGDSEIVMSLYFFANCEVKGNYYENCQKKIMLDGIDRNGILTLTQYYNKYILEYFEIDTKNETTAYNGTWYDKAKGKKKTFKFYENASMPGAFDKKYAFTQANDASVEIFLQSVKSAILAGNKSWVADNIQYPLEIRNQGKLLLVCQNKIDFINSYDKIVTSKLRDAIRLACPFNSSYTSEGILFNGVFISNWFWTKQQISEGADKNRLAIKF